MTLPAAALPTLGKLLPRLASDHDGEVVATARAVGRVLRAAGADWHDLAAAVVGAQQARPSASPEPQSWSEVAQWCRVRAARLGDAREREFVADMAGRLWGGRAPTRKQGAWLRAIYGRLLQTEVAE